MDIAGTFSRLKSKFQYHAALLLAQDRPPQAVRAELIKEKWDFRSSMTQEEALNYVKANSIGGPACAIPPITTKIFSPEGEEVFKCERNQPLEDRYMAAVRKAASTIYGYNPK